MTGANTAFVWFCLLLSAVQAKEYDFPESPSPPPVPHSNPPPYDPRLPPFQPVSNIPNHTEFNSCQPQLQRIALEMFYSETGGMYWHRNDGWSSLNLRTVNITYNCSYAGMDASIPPLPDHCCWYGITCCVLQTCPPANYSRATRHMDSTLCNCKVGTVTQVDLRGNNVQGTITDITGDEITVNVTEAFGAPGLYQPWVFAVMEAKQSLNRTFEQ